MKKRMRKCMHNLHTTGSNKSTHSHMAASGTTTARPVYLKYNSPCSTSLPSYLAAWIIQVGLRPVTKGCVSQQPTMASPKKLGVLQSCDIKRRVNTYCGTSTPSPNLSRTGSSNELITMHEVSCTKQTPTPYFWVKSHANGAMGLCSALSSKHKARSVAGTPYLADVHQCTVELINGRTARNRFVVIPWCFGDANSRLYLELDAGNLSHHNQKQWQANITTWSLILKTLEQ